MQLVSLDLCLEKKDEKLILVPNKCCEKANEEAQNSQKDAGIFMFGNVNTIRSATRSTTKKRKKTDLEHSKVTKPADFV